MTLTINFVPIEQQLFTTLGDWWEASPGQFTIAVSHMPDWRHEFLVLIHELTEWAICQAAGVATTDCDRFDQEWEDEIALGIRSIYTEAGFDARCPYRRGHVWGARMERLFCFLLRASWKDYLLACDNLIEQYHYFSTVEPAQ